MFAIVVIAVSLIGCDGGVVTPANTGIGTTAVDLGSAGDFAILAKTGISTAPASVITGDVGVSPAAETYLTGFSQTDATGYATSPQVTGFLYAADMTSPTPSKLTTAVADMETAYDFAAGRTLPDELNLLSGAIGGQTLTPGLYKWTSSVNISGANLTLTGTATDTWIFQVDGDLTLASAKLITLAGGALTKNIVWQVAGTVTMGANSHFEGVVLCKTNIDVQTSASMNGRLLAQTSVALDQATITQPAL
ncbi:MAG: ice-binding family protein [Sphaerochaeta sp.]